jgi:hypothetical protein
MLNNSSTCFFSSILSLFQSKRFRIATKRFDKPRELGKDMADEVQPRKMLCHPCYQEENSH